MQLATVATVDVGEHGNGARRLLGLEDNHAALPDPFQRPDARRHATFFGQILLGLNIVQITLDQIFTVRGDVGHPSTKTDLVNAGHRRRTDRIGAYVGEGLADPVHLLGFLLGGAGCAR